jgi:hypothetical protein
VGLFKRKAIKTAESEVSRLRQRRDALAGRVEAAEAAAALAVKTQREILVAGDLDGSVAQRAETDCQLALFRHDSLVDALDETKSLLGEAENKLTAEADKLERERVAADLERRAAAIDTAVAELTDTLATVADAHRALVAVVGAEGMRTGGGFIGIEPSALNIATGILAAGLGDALPGLEARPTFRHADSPPARTADAVARELQSDLMRFLAANIRSGAEPAVVPATVNTAPRETVVRIPETVVVLNQPIGWHGVDGRLVQAPEGGCSLPEPVAAAAVARGIGFSPDSPEGVAIMRELASPDVPDYARNQRPTKVRRGPPWTDVGVNLFAYGRDRARAAEGGSVSVCQRNLWGPWNPRTSIPGDARPRGLSRE